MRIGENHHNIVGYSTSHPQKPLNSG